MLIIKLPSASVKPETKKGFNLRERFGITELWTGKVIYK
jgi:hypothetical protein